MLQALYLNKEPARLDLNPSAADRWTTCTASPRFIMENWSKVPPQDNKYSEEGTVAHEVAAAFLENREPKLVNFLPPVNAEMRGHGWDYAEYVQNLVEGAGEIIVEKKYPLWYMPQRNAKIDAAVFNFSGLHIVDYKYGAGIPVSPFQNLQGGIYARSILEPFQETLSLESRVSIHIYQPRGRDREEPFEVWHTTWGNILQFTDEHVKLASSAIQSDEGTVFSPSEKACRWCPAKGFCEARRQGLTADLVPLAEIEEKPLPATTSISVEQLAVILKRRKEIEKWLGDAEDFALDYLKAGHKIPGYKLVLSRGGNRAWSDPKKAKVDLLTILRLEAIEEKILISPAGAEKLLGKNALSLALLDNIYKSPGVPVIAPTDDPREDLSWSAEHDFKKLEPEENP